MFDRPAISQHRFRNSGDLIELMIGSVDDGQLHSARIFRVILGVALPEAHVTLDRKEIGKQSTCQHDDQTGMSEMGSKREMAHIERILREGRGADRQLAVWEETQDMKKVVDHIVAETYEGLTVRQRPRTASVS